MMKKYEKYRNSGIEWINQIPSNWELVKFKRFAKIKNGKDQKEVAIDEGGYPILGTGGEFGRSCQFIHNKPSVLLGRKGTINKPQFIEEPFWTVDTLFYTEIFDDINPKFLFYLSQQIPFDLLQESSAVPSMTQEKLNSVYLCKPSNTEQTSIARYLDHQTAIIDQLIKQKEKLIFLLKEKRQAVINEAVTKGLDPNAKMKDSGDNWIGKVAENWGGSKIKFVANIQGRVGYKGYTKEDIVSVGEGALTLGAKHIDKENHLDLSRPEYIKWEKYDESPEIMVKLNDVIFTQRGSLGKVCHINKDIGKATINPSMVILTPIKILPRFLYYWLYGNRIQSEVEILQSNTAVPMISQYQLSNFPILIPPIAEQMQIVDSIDLKLFALRDLLNRIISQIENLKEYRQSIISEAVTGKIDVRDWESNKNK